MDMMIPGGLLGWGLIMRDQHDKLLAEARDDRLARAALANRPPSRLRVWVLRIAAACAGAGTGEGSVR